MLRCYLYVDRSSIGQTLYSIQNVAILLCEIIVIFRISSFLNFLLFVIVYYVFLLGLYVTNVNYLETIKSLQS